MWHLTPEQFGQLLRQARRRSRLEHEDIALLVDCEVYQVFELEAGRPNVPIGLALAAAGASGLKLVEADKTGGAPDEDDVWDDEFPPWSRP